MAIESEESVDGVSDVGDAEGEVMGSGGEDMGSEGEDMGSEGEDNVCSRQMIETTEFSEDEIMVPKDKVDVVAGDSEHHLAA